MNTFQLENKAKEIEEKLLEVIAFNNTMSCDIELLMAKIGELEKKLSVIITAQIS